ncbi:flavodoxin [Companilactobacillus ginsenosidimutans]|uniref:Flavodoxin-like domain-containing protein n=1 Tax=Companilactobacillus ginsenosidimutans TaxID=1007676 RepID=A0A0H4QE79_9LACO|nr:flavodoxin [Companilactobacillus ginsenosidimutans]AKP66242.1 hypothetical protein ABM34_00870 [Companilactobacillus ginsenosidimutans]
MANESVVVYYSNSGITKKAAEKIAYKTDSDMMGIHPKDAFPTDYQALTDFVQEEIADNKLPELDKKYDVSKYSTIFLGFPTWYERPPLLIDEFLKKTKIAKKDIIPFTTSGSSSIDVSVPFIEKICRKRGAVLVDGFTANDSSDVEKFLNDYLEKE